MHKDSMRFLYITDQYLYFYANVDNDKYFNYYLVSPKRFDILNLYKLKNHHGYLKTKYHDALAVDKQNDNTLK